ncbi:hypothetical protein [Aquirhabdus parva]|uniref:hypothetical protein n=1 Tax=Aquirhabdus parva TaxID=2283318 RepID=UPI0013B42457|nr:hypothetical protein [Aquirhabdus parva]
MRKIYLAAALLFSSLSYAADPALIASNHPILGVWKWTTPNAGCSELYNFKANNRLGFASGAEVGESLYTVSAEPSPKGYYRIENTVASDNGSNDCRGQPGQSGMHSTLFARFSPDGKQVKMCFGESDDQCFGPLTRE